MTRRKRLSDENDLSAKNIEEIFDEFEGRIEGLPAIATAAVERGDFGLAIPKGMAEGQIRIDASGVTKKLVVVIDGELYDVDLTRRT